jgi:hypothetical protein
LLTVASSVVPSSMNSASEVPRSNTMSAPMRFWASWLAALMTSSMTCVSLAVRCPRKSELLPTRVSARRMSAWKMTTMMSTTYVVSLSRICHVVSRPNCRAAA